MSDRWRFYSEEGEVYEVDAQPGRNDPCPCQSGRKYKRCCGEEGAYDWPVLTLIGLDAGSFVVHAHCLRNRETGAQVLLAISPPPGRSERVRRREMVQMVRRIADGVGDEIIRITEADINDATASSIADKLIESPDTNVVIVPWRKRAA